LDPSQRKRKKFEQKDGRETRDEKKKKFRNLTDDKDEKEDSEHTDLTIQRKSQQRMPHEKEKERNVQGKENNNQLQNSQDIVYAGQSSSSIPSTDETVKESFLKLLTVGEHNQEMEWPGFDFEAFAPLMPPKK
jgi:hypothetical protein